MDVSFDAQARESWLGTMLPLVVSFATAIILLISVISQRRQLRASDIERRQHVFETEAANERAQRMFDNQIMAPCV